MRRYFTFLIGLCLITSNSCQTQKHLKTGDDCFNKGDYLCAKQNYSEQKTLGSEVEMDKKIAQCDNCMNLLALGTFYFANNDFLKAKEQFDALLKINKNDPLAKEQLALCNQRLETGELESNGFDLAINEATQLNAQGVAFFNEKKYEKAIELYRQSAELGDAGGQVNLGVMYRNGYGVERDYAEASKWYLKSAEQGNSVGQRNLGLLYENGFGVEKDYNEAIKWYRKSAEQGDADGQIGLANMFFRGFGVEQNFMEAFKLFLQSAEQGNVMGQYNTGLMYESGNGVTQDTAEALKWYSKASAQGHERAKTAAQRLSGN